MNNKNFLVELGTEELPPKSLRNLAESFATNLTSELNKAAISFTDIKWYATPRRLALKINNLALKQEDQLVEKRGPAVSVAFDSDGNPTKAALGWARGNKIAIEDAERLITPKGEWLLYKQEIAGKTTADIIPTMITTALNKLPIPKPMRWGDKDIHFIRPVKTLTILLGDELINAEILGVKSNNIIRGHRFMGEAEFSIANADQYPEILYTKGKVIADYEKRKQIIIQGSKAAAKAIGGKADLEDSLVEEVTSLVEYPVVLTASFEPEFLNVPAEALVYTMKGDQKYFPVYDDKNQLLPNFIFVSNIESKDPELVIAGNEKVVRPRLADAEFFFKNDCQIPLENNLEKLETAIFQKKLGSIKDKTLRVIKLSEYIASLIDANIAKVNRAATLSKCDLMTSMVFEFPDTQGIMGMHYAEKAGEDSEVALALNEQYKPKFAGDTLPTTKVSAALAIADKLDTIVGIFGIGQAPKGSDPFALRRAALGILRIIVENGYNIDLVTLIAKAQTLYTDKLTNKNVALDVIEFMLGRFRAWYQDEGYSVDVIQAVLALKPTKPTDFDLRVKAVTKFKTLDEASSLAAANKRVANILQKFDGNLYPCVKTELLVEPAEIALSNHLAKIKASNVFTNKNYQEILTTLAHLRDDIDQFFDTVMVMAKDENIKINRLTLLNDIRNLFLQVADISILKK